jgi:hypothetical protein
MTDQNQSNSKPVLIVVIIAVVAIAAGGYLLMSKKPASQTITATAPQGQNQVQPTGTVSLAPTPTAAPVGGNADSDITKDLNSIDTKMGNLNSDANAINQSLNDTPVPQAAP